MFFGSIRDRILITEILSAPGGQKLKPEALEIIAVLAMEKRPYYVGDRNEPRQFPRESAQGIVKSLSHCHHVTQGLIREKDQMQREFNLRLRNRLILDIVAWLPGIAAFVYALLK